MHFTIFLLILFVHWANSENILIIGDSHSCGPFGAQVATQLSQNGAHQVKLLCSVGSNAKQWLNGSQTHNKKCVEWSPGSSSKNQSSLYIESIGTPCEGTGKIPALKNLLNKKYDRVVIAHGTNSLHSNQSGSEISELVNAVAATGAKCHWIGPPTLGDGSACTKLKPNLPAYVTSLKSAMGDKCKLFDSSQLAPPRVGDCMHRTGADATDWATKASKSILEVSPNQTIDPNNTKPIPENAASK